MPDVTITSLVGDDAAVVEVTVATAHSGTWRFQGTSKKHPEDKPDRVIGETLALARAFEKASESLQEYSRVLSKWHNRGPVSAAYPVFSASRGD